MKGVKHVHIPVTEKEYKALLKKKGLMSWRKYVLPKLGIEVEE
jgi:hypothetical protein